MYDVYISDIVIREISQCPREKLNRLLGFLDQISYTIIQTSESTVELNVKTVRGVKVITTLEGYKDLLIYPPSVLIASEEEEENE